MQYKELMEKLHGLKLHCQGLAPANVNYMNLTQEQRNEQQQQAQAIFAQFEAIQASVEEENDPTWEVWDALEKAFDELMKFIGTVDIDAVIGLVTKAMDLAILLLESVGGLYADNNPEAELPEWFDDAIKSADKTMGSSFARAFQLMNAVFTQQYAQHKAQHSSKWCGLGYFDSKITDRSLDDKYQDIFTWLNAIASISAKEGQPRATNGQLSGALHLAFEASDHALHFTNGHRVASNSQATVQFHQAIQSINNQLQIFEPNSYNNNKGSNEPSDAARNMEHAIAFSQHWAENGYPNCQVPAKIQAVYNDLHTEVVDKVQFARP